MSRHFEDLCKPDTCFRCSWLLNCKMHPWFFIVSGEGNLFMLWMFDDMLSLNSCASGMLTAINTESHKLPVNKRQEVYSNGSLVLRDVQKIADDGLYSCRTSGGQDISTTKVIILGEWTQTTLQSASSSSFSLLSSFTFLSGHEEEAFFSLKRD